MLVLSRAARGRVPRWPISYCYCFCRTQRHSCFDRQYATAPGSSKSHTIDDIRNIGIIAHVDARRHQTSWQYVDDGWPAANQTNIANSVADVDHGDTVTDFLPMERERGITIQSAAITFQWPVSEEGTPMAHPRVVNLIDTPGHQDFRYEVDRCLPILDGAVCIIDSVKGVEAHTERVWEAAQDFAIPRILYVNKLDRDGASFRRSVLDVGSKLNSMPLVCNMPWWSGGKFFGVIDVIDEKGYRWQGTKATVIESAELREKLVDHPELAKEIPLARQKLIETVCDYDEELLNKFLQAEDCGHPLSSTEIKAAIRRIVASSNGLVVPVFAGSSLRNMGVEPLLDAVVDYLPSPRDRPEIEVQLGSKSITLKQAVALDVGAGQQSHAKSAKSNKSPTKHHVGMVATVFKVTTDPVRGPISFVRVYHGELTRRMALWNSGLQLFEKPTSLMQISANKTHDIDMLVEGQIGAIVGLKDARTGDTLLTFPAHKTPPPELKKLAVRPATIPPAVAFTSIETTSPTAARALEEALSKLSREDPSLHWSKDERTDTHVLSGMGKLHLEIAKHNLKTIHRVTQCYYGGIEVEYKECIMELTRTHHHLYDRPMAGVTGQAGCAAFIAPLQDDCLERLKSQAKARPQHLRVSDASVERDGNVVEVRISAGEGRDTPAFDVDEIRPQLVNGAFAALARGPRRGSPLTRCHVVLDFDGGRDFFGSAAPGHYFGAAQRAVAAALKEAHEANHVAILEPVMSVQLTCPEDVVGAVQQDITSVAGGHVVAVIDEANDGSKAVAREDAGQKAIDVDSIYAPPGPWDNIRSQKSDLNTGRVLEIHARVPLKSMLDYDDHLRSKTKGRHTVLMSLDTFEQVVGPREKALDLLS